MCICRVGENGEWDSYNGIATLDNRTNYYVDKLQPFTVYSFRVLAVNGIGASQPSKESYYMVTLREGKRKIRNKKHETRKTTKPINQ